MTPEHVIFIPGVLLVGVVIGWVLGSRAVKKTIAEQRARLRK